MLSNEANGRITRSWQGTPISRRIEDGYLNATAMCKANGKRWSDYRESDRAEKYLQALESVTGISVNGLIDTKIGGSNGGGTWVHPQVAVDLARWISAPFAVWMDGWFLQQFEQQSQPQDTRLAGDALLKKVSTAMDLLERLGGVDERAQMIFRDVVINDVCNSAGGAVPQLEAIKYMTLSDFLVELECASHKATALATKMGKAVKNIYRKDNGREPLSQPQLVGGKKCNVALYEIDWLRKYENDMRDDIKNLTR